jgi:hypothetical protein
MKAIRADSIAKFIKKMKREGASNTVIVEQLVLWADDTMDVRSHDAVVHLIDDSFEI